MKLILFLPVIVSIIVIQIHLIKYIKYEKEYDSLRRADKEKYSKFCNPHVTDVDQNEFRYREIPFILNVTYDECDDVTVIRICPKEKQLMIKSADFKGNLTNEDGLNTYRLQAAIARMLDGDDYIDDVIDKVNNLRISLESQRNNRYMNAIDI